MKKHFLKSFALLAMLFSALTLSAQSGVDWSTIAWIGNGSGDATYTDKYKCSTTEGLDVIQFPGFATEVGIYMTFPAADINCNISGYDVQGAGIIMHLSSFTAQETEVTVTYAGGSRTFWIYYADGTTGESGGDEGGEGEEEGGETSMWDAIDWITGSDNLYKISSDCISNNGTVEAPAWANNVKGIYITVPSGISSTSIEDAVIMGAGVLLPLTAFTHQETEVTITHALGECTLLVYYANGLNWDNEDWIIGSDNKYKIISECISNNGTVEAPAWANNVKGIYVTVPSGISSTSIEDAVIMGAGVLLPLTAFTHQETEVTITHALGECTLLVYYSDGIPGVDSGEGGEAPVEPTPESIIESTFFAPGWTEETNSKATYNAETGTITVDLKSTFSERWQAQVKVKHDIAFSADKYYQFSAKFHATEEIKNVMIKVDDNAAIVEDGAVTLPANEDFVYTSSAAKGIAGNNKIIVFDFGYASPCQITISDISIVEVTPPAIEHPSPAPVPTVPAEQVFSIYSNAYNPAVHRTMGGWGQSTKEEEVQLAEGDKAFYYTNCNYLGWELNSTCDMTAYPMLHLDIYVATAGSIQFSPVWQTEKEYLKTYNLQAGWNSIDVDLEAEITGVNLTTIYQLKWATMPATCYIDNVYFFNDGTTEPVEPTPVESNYCQNTLTNGANSIDLTCEKVSVGNYRVIIEGDNLSTISGGTWLYKNKNNDGDGNFQLVNTITSSTSTKIVCEFEAIDPVFYTPLYVIMPGEVNYGTISDVIWGTCPKAEEDTQAPTMTSATVESYTHNSAVIAVAAEDNVGVAKYQIVDAGNGVDQTLTAIDGKIALSGLASATTYNLTIYAIDKAGNKSAGLAVAAFTTDALVYCDFPTGNNGDANFGNPDGRILVSLIKITPQNVRVVVKSADAATKNLDLIYIEAAGANPHATTVGADAASSDLRVMSADISYPTIPANYSFMIQWSNPDWNGRWQINLNDVLESNLCPLPTDDEAPVMVSASLVTGSETYNSAVLTVSATDNDEVANYHVVDAANNYNKTVAPVGNQITLTDLTPSTTYNFTVTALDLAGNESENSKTVAVSTHKLEYCEWIIGSENRTDWTDANRLCLLTISKITDKQLLVVAKPVSGANKLDFLQVQAEGAPHQTVTSPAADELSIVLDFANSITEIPLFRILWSNEGVDPNWMTDLKNVKASYLCPHVELGESVDLSKLDLSTGVTTDVKITRKFVKGSGKWNTLSLPFGLDATDIATAFGSAKVVELSSATLVTSTDIDLSVSNVSEIVAGKPYLIQIPASYVPAVIENITLSNTVTAQETATANGLAKMVSVLTPIAFDDAAGGIRFFLNTNGKLSYRSTTNGIMNPYRAYFEFPHINDPATASQVRARVVFNENTETGVDNLINTDAPVKVIENGQLIIIRGGVKYNVQGQKL